MNVVPRSLWNTIAWGIAALGPVDQALTNTIIGACDIVLFHIPTLIILVLLAVVAMRKNKGLWTTVQPWMQSVQQPMVQQQQQQQPPPAGYASDLPVQYMPQHSVYSSEAGGAPLYEITGTQGPERYMLHADGMQPGYTMYQQGQQQQEQQQQGPETITQQVELKA